MPVKLTQADRMADKTIPFKEMETSVTAPMDGVIDEVCAETGGTVEAGELLLKLK